MWFLFVGMLGVGMAQADLVDAAAAGDSEHVDMLLRDGADPNARGRRGRTALIAAAAGGHEGIVRQLLQAGADVHAVDSTCNAAIDLALSHPVAAALEASGASVRRAEVRNRVYQKIVESQRLRRDIKEQGAQRALEEAEQLAIELGDRSVLAHVEIQFAMNAAMNYVFAEAHARLRAARELGASSYCPGIEPELLYQEASLAEAEALSAVDASRARLAREAVLKFEQSVRLFRSAELADRASEVEAQLGHALLTAGEPGRAVDLLKRFVQGLTQETPFTAGAHHALSDAYWATNNREAAIEQLGLAYAIRLRLGDPQVADSGSRLAQRLAAVGKWPLAQEVCRSSLDVRERLRSSLSPGQGRVEYLRNTRPHYQSCIDAYLKGERRLRGEAAEQVLMISEQARARALLEAVRASQGSEPAAIVSPQGLDDVRALVSDGETLFLEYFLDQEGSYASVVANTEAAPVTVVRLSDRAAIERAAREYLARADRVDGKLSNDEAPELAARRLEQAARVLSDLVIAPVIDDLPVSSDSRRPFRLVVVADGLLQRVPFNALPLPDRATGAHGPAFWVQLLPVALVAGFVCATSQLSIKRPSRMVATGAVAVALLALGCSDAVRKTPQQLIDRFEVVNLPSAAVWREIQNRQSQRGPARGVMVIADPKYGSPMPGTPQVMPIELGEESVRQIIANAPLPTATGSPWMRENATRNAFLGGDLSNVRHVVVAAHAQVDYDDPLKTRILLANVDGDGRPISQSDVFLSDIYRMRLRADLVVLAMCSASTGPELRGEGLNSLTRGMLQAGAANVIATLWDVGTSATVQLLVSFYVQLAEQERLRPGDRRAYGLALRAAQIKLREDKPSHFYWAPYVIHGA